MWFVPVVALLLYLSGVCEAEQKTPPPQRGPRQNETHRFRYESSAEPGIFFYCMFCPKKALDDSTYNYMQVQSCLRNYPHDVVWPEVLTPYEWDNKKFPFCNIGETPGCGAPPNITNIDWECERGYSGELHSLYFPCQGRCNLTGEVQYHLYCNTSFKWELTAVSDGSNCRIVERATEKSEDGQNVVLIIGLAVASVLCIVIVAIIVYCFCVRKRCKKKEMKNKLQQEQLGIELQEVHAQGGNRHQDHADPGQIQNNEGVQQQVAIQVPHRADSGNSSVDTDVVQERQVMRKKKALVHKNNLKQGDKGARSCKAKPKNTNVALQTINELPVAYDFNQGAISCNSISLGSQVSESDLSQTISKQPIGHHSHHQPHSLLGVSSRLQAVDTGSLDSPQFLNNDLVNNSLTSLGNSRSQVLSSINTSGEPSLPHNRSHTNNSPSNVRMVNKCDVSIHADINDSTSTTDDNESDTEANESSRLLPKENNTDRNVNERTGLLAEYDKGGPSMDSNVDMGAGIGAAVSSMPGGAGASSGSGRSERSESDGQLSSLGSNLSGSSREPVEHADDQMVPERDLQGHDLQGDNRDHTGDVEKEEDVFIKEKERPRVQVVTNGKLKVDGNKFYVMKDEPFTIAARTIKPYKQAELKVKKEENGTQFIGRSTRNELPDLPNVIRVDRATADDEGIFSWSLLSDLGTATGTIEIIVLDKETEKRPEEPLGASITEHVMEAHMPATQGVQNEVPPQGLLSNTPKLDPNSFANDQPLSGQNSGTAEKPGITNDLVKGERSSLEFGEMPFNNLNLSTFSDRFRTREGPSGSSVLPAQPLDRSSIDVEGEGTLEHETARKTVVEVSGPHNCSANVSEASKTLMAVLKKQRVATFRLLAEQHGVDITWLHTLQFLEDPDCDESESVGSLLHLLSDRGLRLGHLLDYFYSQNLPDRQIVKDMLKTEHTDCSYCTTFNS